MFAETSIIDGRKGCQVWINLPASISGIVFTKLCHVESGCNCGNQEIEANVNK